VPFSTKLKLILLYPKCPWTWKTTSISLIRLTPTDFLIFDQHFYLLKLLFTSTIFTRSYWFLFCTGSKLWKRLREPWHLYKWVEFKCATIWFYKNSSYINQLNGWKFLLGPQEGTIWLISTCYIHYIVIRPCKLIHVIYHLLPSS